MSQILMHWRRNSHRAVWSFFNCSGTTTLMMVCGDLKSRTLTAICCSSDIIVHERSAARRRRVDRRDFLKSVVSGALPLWASSRVLSAQQPAGVRLTDKLSVIDGGGANVVAFSFTDGFVLVDSGAPKSGEKVMAALGLNAKVQTLFNTHYHLDQTGNNELFGAAGAKIIAHEHTRRW